MGNVYTNVPMAPTATERVKRYLRGYGLVLMLTGYLITCITFIQASFHNYQVTIFTNMYNEHWPEVTLFIILGLPCVVYYLYHLYRGAK